MTAYKPRREPEKIPFCSCCLQYRLSIDPHFIKNNGQFIHKGNIDIYRALKEYNANVTIYDPWANPATVKHEYGIEVVNELPKEKFDACIAAVAHKAFEGMNVLALLNEKHVIFDVKCTLDRGIIDARLWLWYTFMVMIHR